MSTSTGPRTATQAREGHGHGHGQEHQSLSPLKMPCWAPCSPRAAHAEPCCPLGHAEVPKPCARPARRAAPSSDTLPHRHHRGAGMTALLATQPRPGAGHVLRDPNAQAHKQVSSLCKSCSQAHRTWGPGTSAHSCSRPQSHRPMGSLLSLSPQPRSWHPGFAGSSKVGLKRWRWSFPIPAAAEEKGTGWAWRDSGF